MRRGLILLTLCAILSIAGASAAFAQSRHSCKSGEVVVDDGETVELRINPNKVTTVYFAGPIDEFQHPRWPGLTLENKGDHLTIHPQLLPHDIDELGSFKVSTPAGMTIIALRAARTPGAADDSCRVIPRSYRQWDVEVERKAAVQCANDLAERDNNLLTAQLELDRLQKQVASDSVRREEWAVLGELLAIRERVPIYDEEPRRHNEGVHVRALAWWMSQSRLYLVFEIHNRTPQPYHMSRFEVTDKQGYRNYARDVRLEIQLNHSLHEQDVILPQYSRTRGIASISPSATLGGQIQLFMSEPQARRPIVRIGIPTLEQARREGKERQRLRERKSEGGLAIHGLTIGGVTWLYDGEGSRTSQAATAIAGAGMRVTYSFNRLFALEIDSFAGGSGSAGFGASASEGSDVLERSASFARVQLGGALRLGQRIIPTVRLGLGAQGSSYRTTSLVEGSTESVTSIFRFDTLLIFGVGVDMRVGNHVIVGMGVAATTPLGSEDLARGIEAGIHLGYGWTPRPD